MKRILRATTVLVLACVLVLGMFGAAFAAGSASDAVEITKAVDGSGNDVKYTMTDVAASVPELTEAIAAEKIDGKEESDLTVLWQKDLSAETLPVTFTFNASAVSSDQNLYVFHYTDGDWQLVKTGNGPSVSAEFESLSPVGLVASKTSSDSSPKTGDNNSVMLWGALMVVAAAGAVGTAVYSRKRSKAN